MAINFLGLPQHFENVGQLRAATRQGLISEPQYKTMSGYDASQTIPGITDNPLVTGATSGVYNIAKSILSPEAYFDPNTYQSKIGPIDSTLLNIQGPIGLSPQDKEKYEGIVSLDPKSLGMGQWSEEDLTDFSGVYDDDKRGTIAFDPNKINEAGMSDMYPFANIPSYLLTKMLPKGLKYLQQKFKNRQGTQKAHEELRNHIENQRAAANQVRQNIQTYGSGDRPNTGMNRPGGGKGQSPTGGDVAGTPFSRGGILGAF